MSSRISAIVAVLSLLLLFPLAAQHQLGIAHLHGDLFLSLPVTPARNESSSARRHLDVRRPHRAGWLEDAALTTAHGFPNCPPRCRSCGPHRAEPWGSETARPSGRR